MNEIFLMVCYSLNKIQ